MMGCFAFPKAPALLEPHHQTVPGHSLREESYPSAVVQSVLFYSPKWLGRKIQEIYFSVTAFFLNRNKRNTNLKKIFFKYSIQWITIPVLYHRSRSTKRKKKLVRRKIFFAAWYQMIWGLGFGDNCCNPLRVNKQNFRFLSILCDWLKSWNSISQRNGKLTKETFTALHHTTYAFL